MSGIAALASAAGLTAWRLGVPDWAISYAFIALFVLVLATAYVRERAIAREAASGPLAADWTPHERLLRARERREQRERDGRNIDAP
jgi:hypothetical protein